MIKKRVNILYACTTDYLPFATVSAVSVKENLNKEYDLHVYFLYADIVKTISEKKRQNTFEYTAYSLNEHNIQYSFINIEENIPLLEGQNIGCWGEKKSKTHYFYLLSPLVLPDIDKVIYLDTDMIVNYDLSEIYEMEMRNKLLIMAEPRGMEEMGDDVSNSGFVILNLKQWRVENTLLDLLGFGKTVEQSKFCDQNLLYQYFTRSHNDRLLLVDKMYNIFPQLFYEINLKSIKILHFTGWEHKDPWNDKYGIQRAGFLWWKYARKTVFYEQFILQNIRETSKISLLQKVFSITNSRDKRYKVITILGIMIKVKRKYLQKGREV